MNGGIRSERKVVQPVTRRDGVVMNVVLCTAENVRRLSVTVSSCLSDGV